MNVTASIKEAYASVRKFNHIAGNLDTVTEDSIDSQIGFCFEELQEAITSFEEGDKVNFLKEVCDMFVTTAGLMQKMEAAGYDVAGALECVNDNNLSKFPLYVNQADLRDGYSVNLNSSYGRYVIKDAGGKVRKPNSYVPADVSAFVPRGQA